MMKRGLSTRDPQHMTDALLRGRQQPIRDELTRRGLDAAVISSDVSTGGDIAYLTHLTLYWSTSLLVVGADGATVFLPALSPRTEAWFRETGLFDDVHSGTDLLGSLTALAGERRYRRLGLVERDRFPQGLLHGIETDPAFETEDLGAVVRASRVVPDAVALADASTAAELVAGALERFRQEYRPGGATEGPAANAEFSLRMAGAWDASVSVVPVGKAAGVRVTTQLRDAWASACVLVGADEHTSGLTGRLRDWVLRNATAGTRADNLRAAFDAFAATIPELAGATWEVVFEPVSDIEARAAIYPQQPLEAGALAHLSVAAWDARGDCLAAWGGTVQVSGMGQAQPLVREG